MTFLSIVVNPIPPIESGPPGYSNNNVGSGDIPKLVLFELSDSMFIPLEVILLLYKLTNLYNIII